MVVFGGGCKGEVGLGNVAMAELYQVSKTLLCIISICHKSLPTFLVFDV